MVNVIASAIWFLLACALLGLGLVTAFTSPEIATPIALFGILAMMIANWIKSDP